MSLKKKYYNINDIEKMSAIHLLNIINKLPGDSLLERILSFCEENAIDAKEVGYILMESEIADQIKKTLWIDGVKHHQINDPAVKEKLNDFIEW